jgi:hypothetical protein
MRCKHTEVGRSKLGNQLLLSITPYLMYRTVLAKCTRAAVDNALIQCNWAVDGFDDFEQ